MAPRRERPSPYQGGMRYGLPDPSYVSDAEWNAHVEKVQSENDEARAKAYAETVEKMLAADGRHAEMQSQGFQKVVNDAFAQAIERRQVIRTPEQRRLQSLGYVKLDDGTIVRADYLERQQQNETEAAASDASDGGFRLIPQSEIDAIDEEEDVDPWADAEDDE